MIGHRLLQPGNQAGSCEMCVDSELVALMNSIKNSIDDTKRVVSDIAVGKANFLMMAYYLVELGQVLEDLLEDEEFAAAEASKASLQRVAGALQGICAFTRHCKDRSRIFLVYKCNEIVADSAKHFQDLIGCLSLMLHETETISPAMNDKIAEMQTKLSSAIFYAEPEHRQIAEEISACLAGSEPVEDHATWLLRRIAQILNLQPFEAAELKQELERDLEAARIEGGLYAFLGSAAVLDDVRKLMSEDASAYHEDDLAIPSSFFCPITRQIMEDPVMLAEAGFTYERSAITGWFERGHKTCPDTGKELESLDLVPNLKLRQNMEEFFNRKRHKTMLHALNQIKAEASPTEVEEAINMVKQLMDVHPKYKRLIVTLDGIRPLVGYIKPAVHHLKERILWILYSVAVLGDEYKSSIVEAGAVPILLRLLRRNPAGNGGPVQLLWEISKCELGRVAILAEEASVVVVASAFNLCTNDQKLQAEQLLYKLCEHNKEAIIQAASSGIFRPLVYKLTSGNEALQLEMAGAICTIDLNEPKIANLVDIGAVPPLLNLLQHGSEASKLEAAKALKRLSSSGTSKVAIAKSGTIPVLVKALSFPMPELGVQIMATLANLATDRQSAAEIDQEGAVGRLLDMLNSKDVVIHEYALKTLQCMAKDSRTVLHSVAELNIVPRIFSLLQSETLSPCCRASILSLFCHLAEDRITRKAIVSSRNMVKYFVKLLEDPMSLDEREAILRIMAALTKLHETKHLMVSEGHLLQVSMDCLKTGSPKMKECAVVILSRLTDQTLADKHVLLNLARLGMIPCLIDVVQTDSERAKRHAVATLGHLSLQTPTLTERQSFFKKLLARVGFSKYKNCKVHAGKCSTKGSFCLVQSEAIPHLINLIRDGDDRSAVRAIDALFTLVKSEEDREKGVDYLVKSGIITLLAQAVGRNESLTEKAVKMLERIYKCRKYRDLKHAALAKSALYTAMTTGNPEARRTAANTLMHLGLMPKSSTYTQTG